MLAQHSAADRDHETWAPVQLCIIITSITQADLYDDVCRNSLLSAPERDQCRSRCRECLSSAVAATVEFSPDDYYYLDPYLGVGAFLSHSVSGPVDLGVGDKVCWNRAINLLTEEQPDRHQPDSDTHMTLVSSTQRPLPFTPETLDAKLSVLRLARKAVGMSVCLVPSGPKTLCSQLMEYRRANGLGGFAGE